MTARWSERAERDVYAIGDYIAADDPDAAIAWIERLRKRADAAAHAPRSGRVVPELMRDDVREVFVRTYRIIYRTTRAGVFVLTVFEGSMQLPPDLDPDAEK